MCEMAPILTKPVLGTRTVIVLILLFGSTIGSSRGPESDLFLNQIEISVPDYSGVIYVSEHLTEVVRRLRASQAGIPLSGSSEDKAWFGLWYWALLSLRIFEDIFTKPPRPVINQNFKLKLRARKPRLQLTANVSRARWESASGEREERWVRDSMNCNW